ncbi:MAG: helix-hairpin-helix domain-containing protein [Campylobacterales bacterium]
METSNHTIAATFMEIAELLEIDEANPFRIRAYRNAARTIDALPHKLSKMVAEGDDLTELPGIGESLAQKIEEIVKTGGLKAFESLKKRIPPELETLLEIPGLGPKRVHDLFTKLRIRSLSDLQKALEAGNVQALEGFGPKLIESIAEGIQQKKLAPKRYRLNVAEAVAKEVLGALESAKGIKAIEVAGSIRRRKETVKDIDIIVAASMDSDVMDVFVTLPDVKRIVMQGPTRSSVELSQGLHVDLRVVQPEAFGSALHHFTGSKAHLRRPENGLHLPGTARGPRRGRPGPPPCPARSHYTKDDPGRPARAYDLVRRQGHPRSDGARRQGTRLRIPRGHGPHQASDGCARPGRKAAA